MKFYHLAFVLTFSMATSSSFKTHQLTFTRVEEAYAKYGSHVQSYLSSCEIDPKSFNLYLRCFKHEKLLELWAKSNSDDTYKLLKTYELYGFSGTLGPKRAQGDYQIPEGFYHIDRFNPMSKFHLSLGINYPNVSDKVLSHKQKPGGDIFIHGGCQTIGCMPISDEWIEELYVYCVEAKNSGQKSIPVNIFPFKMEVENTVTMKGAHPELASNFVFWDNIQPGYHFFEKTRTLPKIQFNTDGSHTLK